MLGWVEKACVDDMYISNTGEKLLKTRWQLQQQQQHKLQLQQLIKHWEVFTSIEHYSENWITQCAAKLIRLWTQQ